MRRGKLAQAQERLEAVLSQTPAHPYADGFLGEIFLTKGDARAAEAQLDKATRVNPKWTTPWAHLARIRYADKRIADGDKTLLEGLESNPDNEQLRLLLALSLTAQHRYEEAISQYEAVLRVAPGSILAANNLASMLVDYKGDSRSLERALALSRGFESRQPNPYLLDTLGWVHHKLGHGPDALRLLQQASALAPDHPVLNYHLGAALAKAGQHAEAAAYLKKAVDAGTRFDGLEEAKALLGEVAG
jgi:predicted Zn-dependent protease